MQITNTEIQGTKYVQIYLTEEELQKKETKDLVKKYKPRYADEILPFDIKSINKKNIAWLFS